MKFRNKGVNHRAMADLFLENYPDNTNYAESFRSLRTNINFSFLEQEMTSLLITSADAGEGKSTCVANLAYTLSLSGKKVLVIDADLRKPALSRILPAKGSPGLSGILSDIFSTDVAAGSFADFRLADLVRLIGFQKKTGFLHLTENHEKIDLHFLNGVLTGAMWLTRPEEKKMAALLLRKKLLTREQIQYAVERQKHTGQTLGFVLINMGLAKEDDLTGFINMHLIEVVRNALQFHSGTFTFEKRPALPFRQSSFGPGYLPDLYSQAIAGTEEHAYLQKKINACIAGANTDNLFFLPSGAHPPKPAELLGSERMAFLLSYLKQRFDVLVIDSPPIMRAGDALILAPQSGGVVFVVKAGQANRDLIKKGVEQLQRAKINLLGVVLNQVDVRKKSYYRGYYKYESYYDEENE